MTIAPTAEATGAAKPAMSKGHLVALKPPRLPYHEAVEERFGIDRAGWKALVEAIYPNAETADAVVMALQVKNMIELGIQAAKEKYPRH